MNLLYKRIVLYKRIMLYNRTISSLLSLIFTGVTSDVFYIIYFHFTLNALVLARFCRDCVVRMKYKLMLYL